MKRNLKSILPHGIAVLVFITFAMVYFSPLFTGYNLIQSDVKQFKGMSKEIVDQRVMEDTDPLWTNSMFGGMPAYQISVLHSNNYINTVDQILKIGLPRPAGILFIAMLGFYILLMCLRINPWLAIAGAVAFGFSTINILYIGAGHMSKVNAIAYMAPALGGMILAFRGKWLLGSVVFALFLSLNLSANHLQMTYYLLFLLSFVAVGEITRIVIAKESKSLLSILGALFMGGLIAVLPSMSNILTTQEYSQYSTRGTTDLTITPDGKEINSSKKSGLDTDYILEYNYGEGELLSTIIPNARGERGGVFGDDDEVMNNSSDEYKDDPYFKNMKRYWGGQSSSGGAFYFGVVTFVLFVLAIVFLKDVIKWPVLLLIILAMSLASNDPGGLNDFFINKFPMYNKFRDSKMILVILQIVLPMLSILFVNELINNRLAFSGAVLKKRFYITSGVILAVFAILYVSPSVSGNFKNDKSDKAWFGRLNQMSQGQFESTYINNPEKFKSFKSEVAAAREYVFKKDVGRALLFSILILGLIYFMIVKRPSIWIVSGTMLFLVSIDNIGISLRYLNAEEDIDDKRGEGQYIASLSAQNYLEESEDLIVLNKYENAILSQIPAQLASVSDMSVLEKEKGLIPSFSKKSAQFKSKMSSYYLYEGIISDKTKSMVADFATLNLNSDYRVLKIGNPFNETQTSYYHKSIGGYHGAKLKGYQELIDFYIQREHSIIEQNVGRFGPAIFQFTPILNMLNTKYCIVDPSKAALVNNSVQGNAWYVSNVKMVKNANEEMLALGDSSINLRNTAIISSDFKNIRPPKSVDSSAKIILTKYGVNTLQYSSNNKFTSPVIFSEIYYPEGWNCYVDGKQVDVFRANYILRGVMVPAGKHKIEWRFEPTSMETGSLISGIGSLLLILTCLTIFFVEIKGELKTTDEKES